MVTNKQNGTKQRKLKETKSPKHKKFNFQLLNI